MRVVKLAWCCIWNEQLHNSIERSYSTFSIFSISCGGISCLTMDHYFDRWNISIFMENRCGSLWEMKQFNWFVCITFGNYGKQLCVTLRIWHVWILKYIATLHATIYVWYHIWSLGGGSKIKLLDPTPTTHPLVLHSFNLSMKFENTLNHQK